MYLAYFDESGDSGAIGESPTRFFVLACVLVHEAVWLENLSSLVRFRSALRQRYGISRNAELKANLIRKGRGPLAELGWPSERRGQMFRYLMLLQQGKLILKTFAVAIDKMKFQADRDAREVAWQYTLQRVDTFCRKTGDFACLFPDAGHGYFIRRLVRRLRRHQVIEGRFGGVLKIQAERIVEDPNERHSQDSYFIQIADWNAYAAHRSTHIDPSHTEFANAWDELGDARLLQVNALRGGPQASFGTRDRRVAGPKRELPGGSLPGSPRTVLPPA